MAKLTTKQRNSLPKSKFAEPAERKYPIDTINRGRTALARVSGNGTPAEQATVRRKVHERFPAIGRSKTKPHTGFRSVQAAIDKKMKGN